MTSLLTRLREKVSPSARENLATEPTPSPTEQTEKQAASEYADDNDVTSSSEYIPKDAQAGELTLDETASGGLGRHLGVFSTTFLMSVLFTNFLLSDLHTITVLVALSERVYFRPHQAFSKALAVSAHHSCSGSSACFCLLLDYPYGSNLDV